MLTDNYLRKFPYLRLSITDACNFRCQYCLPNGYQKTNNNFLSANEIERLVRAFVGLGTTKVRLTGGEPTLRKDLAAITTKIKSISGLQKIAMTTNGYNLKQKAQHFYDMGITALNVSIDSLERSKFHLITGHDKLLHILNGIAFARRVGFETLKVNAVLLRGINDTKQDIKKFLTWIKSEDISVRFIELMQTGNNKVYFDQNHVSGDVIKQILLDEGFMSIERKLDDGPAIEFLHPDYQGKIGLIAPYSKDFCKSCNRLRVTARGDLRLCLFGTLGYSLRAYLDDDEKLPELQNKILELLHFKKESHALHQGKTGLTTHLASLGG